MTTPSYQINNAGNPTPLQPTPGLSRLPNPQSSLAQGIHEQAEKQRKRLEAAPAMNIIDLSEGIPDFKDMGEFKAFFATMLAESPLKTAVNEYDKKEIKQGTREGARQFFSELFNVNPRWDIQLCRDYLKNRDIGEPILKLLQDGQIPEEHLPQVVGKILPMLISQGKISPESRDKILQALKKSVFPAQGEVTNVIALRNDQLREELLAAFANIGELSEDQQQFRTELAEAYVFDSKHYFSVQMNGNEPTGLHHLPDDGVEFQLEHHTHPAMARPLFPQLQLMDGTSIGYYQVVGEDIVGTPCKLSTFQQKSEEELFREISSVLKRPDFTSGNQYYGPMVNGTRTLIMTDPNIRTIQTVFPVIAEERAGKENKQQMARLPLSSLRMRSSSSESGKLGRPFSPREALSNHVINQLEGMNSQASRELLDYLKGGPKKPSNMADCQDVLRAVLGPDAPFLLREEGNELHLLTTASNVSKLKDSQGVGSGPRKDRASSTIRKPGYNSSEIALSELVSAPFVIVSTYQNWNELLVALRRTNSPT